MKKKTISEKRKIQIFIIIAAIALICTYFKFKNSCTLNLRCETHYCAKIINETIATCVTRLMIIYSGPVVLASYLSMAGIVLIANRIIRLKPRS